MATATLQDLRDICYSLLREEEGVSAYPLVLMDQLINAAEMRICNWYVVNPINRDKVKKWQLPFLNTSVLYKNLQTTTTTAIPTVWGTVLEADTAVYDATGVIYVWGVAIAYTWKTATSFTWCDPIPFEFPIGTEVSAAFVLPDDYASAINLIYNNRFEMPMKLYDDIFEDLNKYKRNWFYRNEDIAWYNSQKVDPFYTILDNQYMLLYNMNKNGDMLKLRYTKMPTTMVNSTDQCTIPNATYAKSTIPYLAIWEMLYNRGEEWRAAELLNFVCWQIREMYDFYNNTMFQDISGKQYNVAKSPRGLNI